MAPAQHRHTGEFGTVVGDAHCWLVALGDDSVEFAHDPQPRQRGVGNEWRGRRYETAGRPAMAERIRFSSAILPLWARRTRSLDALLPVLYLRGISTGDFREALTALLGKDAPNLSHAAVSRLTAEWQGEYARWQKRDLSARRYVYVWADGVFPQARMEDHGECMLVLIGATLEGKKELIGFRVGVRESAQRGLQIAPEIAVGDGALGFWKALDEIIRHRRTYRVSIR
jgi:transposase-like protein